MRPRVPNDELHRRRQAARWSQHQLAHQVNRLMAADGLAPTCAAKRVGRWERGEATPDELYRPYLAAALGCTLAALGLEAGHNAEVAALAAGPRPVVLVEVPDGLAELAGMLLAAGESGTLVALPGETGGSSVERRAFNRVLAALAAAAVTGRVLGPDQAGVVADAAETRRIGMTGVASLRTVIEGYRRLDDELGSAALRPLVDGSLRMVAGLRRAGQRDQVAAELGRVGAELHQLAGWLAFDAADHRAADRHLRAALVDAGGVGDDAMAAHALGWLSYVASFTGDGVEGVDRAEAALARAARTPSRTLRASVATVKARAHAQAGEGDACKAALDLAERELAAAKPEDDPAFVYYFDQAAILAHRGMALVLLSEVAPAQEALGQALAGLDPTYTRDRAFFLTYLAASLEQAGEAAEAARVSIQTADLLEQTSSGRAASHLRALHARLRRAAPDVPEVRALGDRLGLTARRLRP